MIKKYISSKSFGSQQSTQLTVLSYQWITHDSQAFAEGELAAQKIT